MGAIFTITCHSWMTCRSITSPMSEMLAPEVLSLANEQSGKAESGGPQGAVGARLDVPADLVRPVPETPARGGRWGIRRGRSRRRCGLGCRGERGR